MLWGLSGGPLAVRFLDEQYYGQYLRACQTGGMESVCAVEHFANLSAVRPENKNLLLALDPVKFISAMTRWRDGFLAGKDNTVLGLSDDELRKIIIPTAIVPYYDKIHLHSVASHAHKMIPNSHFFDFDPLRSENTNFKTESELKSDEEIVAGIIVKIMQLKLREI